MVSVAGVARAQTSQKPAQTAGQKPPAASPGETTTTVSAPSASVHARCDEASPLRITLGRGETVVVQGVQDNWVTVRVATGEDGCVRRSLLAPIAAMQRADEARRARQAASAPGARRPAAPSRSPRAVISVNGVYQAADHTFSDEETFPLHQETARFTADYEVQAAPGLDAGGAVRLWRDLGVGVAVSTFKDDRDITIEGTLPHPFFFDRPRAISGVTPGTREEIAVHLNAVYFATASPKFQALIFGGASFFSVTQSVVTSVNYSETYPYDTASFTSAVVREEKESKVGFNVGADIAYYFSRYFGVGGIVRFSKASVPFSIGDLDVGGASVGGGVRIRIP